MLIYVLTSCISDPKITFGKDQVTNRIIFVKQVNFPNCLKAEQYPHYMQRGADITYESFSILGQIYNRMEKSKDEASQTKGENQTHLRLTSYFMGPTR